MCCAFAADVLHAFAAPLLRMYCTPLLGCLVIVITLVSALGLVCTVLP